MEPFEELDQGMALEWVLGRVSEHQHAGAEAHWTG